MVSVRTPQAPYFNARVLGTSGLVGQAFDEWVKHWNSCETCRRDEWYEPSDTRWFCAKGAQIFKRWDYLTVGVTT